MLSLKIPQEHFPLPQRSKPLLTQPAAVSFNRAHPDLFKCRGSYIGSLKVLLKTRSRVITGHHGRAELLHIQTMTWMKRFSSNATLYPSILGFIFMFGELKPDQMTALLRQKVCLLWNFCMDRMV